MTDKVLVVEGVSPGLLESLKVRWKAERKAVEDELAACEMELMRWEVRERRQSLAALHPILMGRIYFPAWLTKDSPPVHFEIIEQTLKNQRFGCAAPVSIAKTTIMTKLTSLWGVLFGGIENILLITAAQDLSSTFLTDMASKIEHSEELMDDFGEIRGTRWGSDTLEFRFPHKTAWIRALGRLGTSRGRRPQWIFLDDPEDEESVKSDKQRDDFHEWFWGALVGRLDPGPVSKLVYIGTCISEETFLTKLIRTPPPGWTVRHYALLNEETNESLWPDKWPLPEIEKRRKEIGEEKFQQEYQNNPVKSFHQRVFDMSQVKIMEWKIVETDFVSVAVDPSFVVGGDEWAVTVIAVDRNGDWHEMDSFAQATGTSGWLECLLNVRAKYPKINACGIESGSTQTAVVHIVSKWMKEYGIWLPVTYLKHNRAKGSKEQRITRTTGIVNTGRLTVTPGHQAFWTGMERYKSGIEKQDDAIPDSFAMHLELQQARVPTQPIQATVEELRHKRIELMKSRRRQMGGQKRVGLLDAYG